MSKKDSITDYLIRTRPHLSNLFKAFIDVEVQFRDGLKSINKPLEELIRKLEEVAETNDEDQLQQKIVPKTAVYNILDVKEAEWPLLYNCIRMQFFCVDSQEKFDYDKIVLFCIFYCDADPNLKTESLFKLMTFGDHISWMGMKVSVIFSYLTVIACVATSEIIHWAEMIQQ